MIGMTETATRTSAAINGDHPAAQVLLENIRVVYRGEFGGEPIHALQDIDLKVAKAEFVSLIGPSGCGKSTLLRVLADLIRPTAGAAHIGGDTPRAARLKREVGFVFQDPALLEWRKVMANVALPLEIQGVSRAERRARAAELIETVGLKGFENAYPRQLSGGMRQRVAIARAMSTNPNVMLMDEPFGALDQITRDRLNLELLVLSQRQQMTVLFITHSIREAVLLSDRVVVMTPRPGRIVQVLDIDLPRPRTLQSRETDAFERMARAGVQLLEQGFRVS